MNSERRDASKSILFLASPDRNSSALSAVPVPFTAASCNNVRKICTGRYICMADLRASSPTRALCHRRRMWERLCARKPVNIFRHDAAIRNATSASNSLVCHSRIVYLRERERSTARMHTIEIRHLPTLLELDISRVKKYEDADNCDTHT